MKDEPSVAPDDEAFLDLVFERALDLLGRGIEPEVDSLLDGRSHMRDQTAALVDLARRVAMARPVSRPEVAGYALLRELGRGAMGSVFLAEQLALGGRPVALKVLPESQRLSPRARERFVAESRALARLRHPNVVAIHDVVETEGICAYAMEWVDGATLAQLIAHLRASGTTPDLDRVGRYLDSGTTPRLAENYTLYVCRLGIELARALAAVHEAGLLHRDVKPSNVLLRRDGTAVLSDFGLARDPETNLGTRTGQFVGTPAYASPEQLEGKNEALDPRSDVYSLGMTLYHALALELPFQSESIAKILLAIASGELAPLRRHDPKIPRDLETIVGKAIESEPEHRYQSAGELADDLERLVRLEPIHARPVGHWARLTKLMRRNRPALVGAALGGGAVIALAVLAAIYAWRSPREIERLRKEAQLLLVVPDTYDSLFHLGWPAPENSSQPPALVTTPELGTRLVDALELYDQALAHDPFALLRGRADLALERTLVALAEAIRTTSATRALLAEQLGPELPLTKRVARDWTFAATPPHASAAELALRTPRDRHATGLLAFLLGGVDLAAAAWSTRPLDAAPDALADGALGELYLIQERADLAYPRFLSACRAAPDSAFLYSELADCAVRLGDLDVAEELLDRADTLRPVDPFETAARVRADLYRARGELSQARTLYEQLFLRRSGPRLLRHYASLLEELAEYPQAIGVRRRNVERHSEVPLYRAEFVATADAWWRQLAVSGRWRLVREFLDGNSTPFGDLASFLREVQSHRAAYLSVLGSARGSNPRSASMPPVSAATHWGTESSLPLQIPELFGLAERMSVRSTDPTVFRSLPRAQKDLLTTIWMAPMKCLSREPLRTLIHGFFLTCALSSSAASQTPSWEAQVLDDIREGEYGYQPVAGEAGVWSAPNRSQGLRSRISMRGLEVFPRQTNATGLGAPWKLTLGTKAFGRVGDLRALSPASVTAQDRRAQLDHGLLLEWIENREDGIEQGWTIAAPPPGVDPLWIGLEIGGELSFRIDEDTGSAVLVDPGGEVRLRYQGLMVLDATGRELPARMSSTPEGLGIQIDDAGATYPLVVDPVLTGPAWIAEGDQAGAEFGVPVAPAGDVNGDGYSDVLVGARLYDNGQADEGRAFLYLGSPSGLSTSVSWTAESNQASAHLGGFVATAGDVNGDGYSDVVIAAYQYDNGQTEEGAAFVWMGSASGLGPVGDPTNASWSAEGDQAGAYFGDRVGTAGDVNGDGFSDVIISAYQYDNGQADEGAAFVWLGSASGLGPNGTPANADWMAESNQASAQLGVWGATAGDVNGDGYDEVVAGASLYDNGHADEGAAFVWLGSASGLGPNGTPANADWMAESDQSSARLGISAVAAGDVNGDGYGDLFVGANAYDIGQTDEGAAFLWLGSASGLGSNGTPANADWRAESDQVGAGFAADVSTAGDVNGDGYGDVSAGSEFYAGGKGAVFVWLGSAVGLGPNGTPSNADWSIEGDQVGAMFGLFTTTAGDVNGDGYGDLIVGAHRYDNDQAEEGRAFTYHGSALGLAASPAWTSESNQSGAYFGVSVSSAGDVNGDGFGDLIVGARFYDNGQTDEGRAFLYLGSKVGPSLGANWTAESDQSSSDFGVSVASAGDVNGDGFSDVIVGAHSFDHDEPGEGRAYVFLGSAGGLSASAAWTVESDQPDAFLGYSVAGAGDVNGDGYGDVIVGAHFYDGDLLNEGRAFVYHGSAAGLSTAADWMAEGDQLEAFFGVSVASAGDVNRDGHSDVIVGALRCDNPDVDEGCAYLFLGSASGLGDGAAWMADGGQAGALFGISVGSAGDVNGDGYSDAIVGAYLHDGGQIDEGRAAVYLGSVTGLAPSPHWTAESDQADAWFGYCVATAGDVNGDGYSDVIVGAYHYDDGQTDEGRAFVYLGSATGLAPSADWTAESDQAGSLFGVFVGTAGDVNGDGYGDVIVGAPLFDNGEGDEGRAFVYLGNEGNGGWTLAAQQRRTSDLAPIDLLGRSDNSLGFRIQLAFEKHLAGFTWASPATPTAKLEWQVAELGDALDSRPFETGSSQTITGLPLVFNELVPFPLSLPAPTANRSYHWRARLRTNNPLLPVTPWVSIPWNNVTEAKLRAPTAARPK